MKHRRLIKSATFSVGLLGIVLAGGCAESDQENTIATQNERTVTLATALGSASDLNTLRDALGDSELGAVLDGPASFTVLAPRDAAFEALGEDGEALMRQDQRPVLVAVLRNHLLPGHLTPESIGEAIAATGGPVTMTTLGEGSVTFSKSGDQLVVQTPGGSSSAHIVGTSTATGNGVVIPVDTVLMPPSPDG